MDLHKSTNAHRCTHTHTHRRKNDPPVPNWVSLLCYTSTVMTADSSDSLLKHKLKFLVLDGCELNCFVPVKFPLKQWPPNMLGKRGLSGTSNCALLAAEDGWYWLVYCQLDTTQNPREESWWPVAGVGSGSSSGNLTLNVGSTIS